MVFSSTRKDLKLFLDGASFHQFQIYNLSMLTFLEKCKFLYLLQKSFLHFFLRNTYWYALHSPFSLQKGLFLFILLRFLQQIGIPQQSFVK